MSWFTEKLDKASNAVSSAITSTSRSIGASVDSVYKTLQTEATALGQSTLAIAPPNIRAGVGIAEGAAVAAGKAGRNAVARAEAVILPAAASVSAAAVLAGEVAGGAGQSAASAAAKVGQKVLVAGNSIKAAADQVCWSCIAGHISREVASGLAFDAVARWAGNAEALKAFQAARPFMTPDTAAQIGLSAAKGASTAKFVGVVGAILQTADAFELAMETRELARNDASSVEVSSSASKFTGTALAAVTGAGAAFGVAAVISAPLWVTVAAPIVVGAVVTLGAKAAWDRWGHGKAQKRLQEYIDPN